MSDEDHLLRHWGNHDPLLLSLPSGLLCSQGRWVAISPKMPEAAGGDELGQSGGIPGIGLLILGW